MDVAKVNALRGRNSAFEPREGGDTPSTPAPVGGAGESYGAGVEGLFGSLLAESYNS